ncbi:MAG: peptidoglycan DD-metalloendopeptidase family protein [Clostridiales bacterium]|nr:peptidoglycan DD-metalloendopeptidase family protein [Clostridiales bacterium]
MLWRNNKGKNKPDNQTENRIAPETDVNDYVNETVSDDIDDKERLLEENEDAKRMYEEIQALRQSIAALKTPEEEIPLAEAKTPEGAKASQAVSTEDTGELFKETEEIRLAKQAIMEQARKDEVEKARQAKEARLREIQVQKQQQEALEAQRRVAAVQQEAERKRWEAEEAERRMREVSIRNVVKETQEQTEQAKLRAEREAFFMEEKKGIEEFAARKKSDEEKDRDLTEAKAELLSIQKEQRTTNREIEARKKRENKVRRAAEKAEKEEIKRAKKAAAISEKERLAAERKAAAELGAGIVNIKGVKVTTELNEEPTVSWKDFFGIKGREERKAIKEASKEEKMALEREREARKEEARLKAEMLSKQRQEKYRSSRHGILMGRFKRYCDKHKVALLTVFGVVLIVAVGTAGIFNYCTAYEYSYNGKALGYVKEKDEVLRITDLVQGALTEDKKVDVVIDAKDDIEFKRVPAMGQIDIDTSDDVLKRLSYMGDVNVKAMGIYINGEKIGAVDNKSTAAKVLEHIKEEYSCKEDGAKTEEAVFIENVEIKRSNTSLQDISSEKEMVDVLCTSGEKESIHKVVVGETLADIAKLYSMAEDDILKDNTDIDPKKLEVGTSLVIRQNAPILTVKITYVITHDKVIEHKVNKKDAPDIYEGYTKTQQAGKDGLNEVTERVTTVNGESIEAKALSTTIKEEPVTEVILIGTKERPPTVGSGKYIWPISSGYTLTSEFGYRWGSLHEGIDLGVPTGTTVKAADGGTVVSSGYEGAYGYCVIIDHQNGMKTRYAHNSRNLVSVGEKVFQGQEIALSGNTGRSTGPHLHFEVIVGGEPQNPLNYLP